MKNQTAFLSPSSHPRSRLQGRSVSENCNFTDTNGVKFDKKGTKKAKNCRFSQKKVLERSLKSLGILFLKKCGNHVDPIGFSDMPDLVVWSEITLHCG